ncbi:hypothetical protein [Sphingomonas sp. dw_22]|uniref:hypothetical protein n=1 Tax=Sphingomonas sp. dw_22 TaxID=2721175 RepID=UPI001BD4DABC|nr:hypothetical protein [Sphingomonas sp. dw_22]
MALPTIPGCLQSAAGTDESRAASDLRAVLLNPAKQDGGVRSATDRATEINNLSSKNATFTQNFLRLSNWASQGATGEFRDYSYCTFQSEADQFFKGVFEEARVTASAVFSRTDLFHGHVLWHKTDGLIVVFHAKEYPNDLETSKSGNGRVADPISASFDKYDANYGKRNIRYSFRSHTIAIVTQGLTNDIGQQTLDQTYGGSAAALFDLNYFPNECTGTNDKVFIA